MVPVGHNLYQGQRGRVIRVPSRGIIRGSDQEVLGTVREVSGRAIRVQTAIRTSRVRMVNSSFSRASRARGGTVTATRAGDSRDSRGGNFPGKCFVCGKTGHKCQDCPDRGRAPQQQQQGARHEPQRPLFPPALPAPAQMPALPAIPAVPVQQGQLTVWTCL